MTHLVRLSIVVTALGLWACSSTSFPEAEDEPQVVTVMVARGNIDLGTLIDKPESMFKAAHCEKGKELNGSVGSFGKLKDRRLTRPLTRDELVKQEDLLRPVRPASPQKYKGLICCDIKVTEPASAGSKVDVILTVTQRDRAASEVILEDLLVVCVDRQRIEDYENNVALAVTKAQAAKLLRAQEAGTLSLRHRVPARITAYAQLIQSYWGWTPKFGSPAGSKPSLLAGE